MALARNRWRILFLWLVVSTPLDYLIYSSIEPTYEARALIQVEPGGFSVSDPRRVPTVEPRLFEAYLQTQARLLTSDAVLSEACASSSVLRFPMILRAADPQGDLRERMVVRVEPNTCLIRLSVESPDRNEAATILGEVINAYLSRHHQRLSNDSNLLRERLAMQLRRLDEEIERVWGGQLPGGLPGRAAPPEKRARGKEQENVETLILNHKLKNLFTEREVLADHLAQADFEPFRVLLVDPATAPKVAEHNRQITYTVAASIYYLLVILGAFSLSEIRVARRAARERAAARS